MEVSWERRLAWGRPVMLAMLAARLGMRECLATREGRPSPSRSSLFSTTKRALLSGLTEPDQWWSQSFISTFLPLVSVVKRLMISQRVYRLERLSTEFTEKRLARIRVNVTQVDLETFFALRNSPANSTSELGHEI